MPLSFETHFNRHHVSWTKVVPSLGARPPNKLNMLTAIENLNFFMDGLIDSQVVQTGFVLILDSVIL